MKLPYLSIHRPSTSSSSYLTSLERHALRHPLLYVNLDDYVSNLDPNLPPLRAQPRHLSSFLIDLQVCNLLFTPVDASICNKVLNDNLATKNLDDI